MILSKSDEIEKEERKKLVLKSLNINFNETFLITFLYKMEVNFSQRLGALGIFGLIFGSGLMFINSSSGMWIFFLSMLLIILAFYDLTKDRKEFHKELNEIINGRKRNES